MQNTGKQVDALNTETYKSLKEIQENTIRQVKELNKNAHNINVKIETTKKSQRETTQKIENLEKRAFTTNRIQEIKKRLSGIEDTIEVIDMTVKENTKCKKLLIQNIQEIQDKMKRPNLRIVGIEESEDSQFKKPDNKFNIIEKNFLNLKKEMAINIREA